MKHSGFVLIFALAFAFSCAHQFVEGRKIDSTKMSTLTLDLPREKVLAVFGPPSKTEPLPSGEIKYVYQYYSITPRWWFSQDVEKQDLEICFQNDTVQSFKLRSSETDPVVHSNSN